MFPLERWGPAGGHFQEGDNDWPAIVRSLDAAGYSGWVIAEPPYRTPGLEDRVWLGNIARQMDRILAM